MKSTKRTLSLSASKVDLFYGCKRLYKYRYVDQPFPPPRKKAFIIGTIAHTALELFHKRSAMPQEKWPLIMSKAFKKAIEREYDEKKTLPPLTRAEKLDIKSMLQAYLNEYREIDRPEHLCFEKSFEIRIAGFKVRGIADRVDRTKRGSLKIVDYKTSKYPMRATEAFESVQLPTYAIWARQAIEDCKVFGEYVYLRHLGTKAGHQTFKISDELIEDAIEKYAEVGEALSNGCKFVRNTTFKWCGNRCEFHDYCIKDEED